MEIYVVNKNENNMINQKVNLKGICIGINEKTGKYKIKLQAPNTNKHEIIEISPELIGLKPTKDGTSSNENKQKIKSKDDKKCKKIIYNHLKMKKLGIIADPRAEILIDTSANFNFGRLYYEFKKLDNDTFQVRVQYRVRFGAKQFPFKEPRQISLRDLENKWASKERLYELDVSETEVVMMNLFKLIEFLKTGF